MLEMDIETFNTLWPTLLAVTMMVSVMIWALVKVMQVFITVTQTGQRRTESPFDTVQSVKGLLGFQHDKLRHPLQSLLSQFERQRCS